MGSDWVMRTRETVHTRAPGEARDAASLWEGPGFALRGPYPMLGLDVTPVQGFRSGPTAPPPGPRETVHGT